MSHLEAKLLCSDSWNGQYDGVPDPCRFIVECSPPQIEMGLHPGTLVHVVNELGVEQGRWIIGVSGFYPAAEFPVFWGRENKPPQVAWFNVTRNPDGSWNHRGIKLLLFPIAL